ncbi:NAD-dependent epimerase/dehydratase family protein [Frigidibacter oleivorans]|uniref:NAD-dependent epimerase/dehydratase family protein n=1 Tax=Frigidibacter oleivorans TaxID=2487129 RepID=UPI000F8CC766|nr:NAD-dependent epimerase/dehydratase family protein [Frigidibacter oleivorans]
MTARIAILGAGGQVGRLLQRAWPGPPPLWLTRRPAPDALAWDLPARPPAALSAAPAGEQAGRLAGTDTLVCLLRPPADAPVEAHAALAQVTVEAARHIGVGRLLLASSIAVYGRDGAPWDEDAPLCPANDYGRGKCAMEAVALAAPLPVTVLRLGNVVGADALSAALASAAPVTIDRTGPAGPLRSVIGAGALARVLLALAHRAEVPPVLNVALPGAVGMADLARAAGRHAGWRAPGPAALARAEMRVDRLQRLLPRTLPPADAAALIAEWQCADRAA